MRPEDLTDEDLRLGGPDRPFPVYHPTEVRGDPDDNYYEMSTREGATIYTMCEDGVYWVLVTGDGLTRNYTDAQRPHARNVFWSAMAMYYAQLESCAEESRAENEAN